jgi:L-rhamnose mutarotase
MKIDITSMFFNSSIDGQTATPAWGTAISKQNPPCLVLENTEITRITNGLLFSAIQDCENLDTSKMSSTRELMIASIFDNVYINNIKVDGSFILFLVREHSQSHNNRLILSYPPYAKYNNNTKTVDNSQTILEMAKALGCTTNGSWFVYDIDIENQDTLYFKGYVLDANNAKVYKQIKSQDRSKEWRELISGVDSDFVSEERPESTLQTIYYGAPGTGKSHKVKEKTGELLADETEVEKENVFRTTFHPDTDYAAFVGCYKPTMGAGSPKVAEAKNDKLELRVTTPEEEAIRYDFVPQVFTNAYVYAYAYPKKDTFLVIEEINRGNCAQIFGDLFQLLDRKNGVSEYKIKADTDLARYLKGVEFKNEDGEMKRVFPNIENIEDVKLCLPVNLHILATMNTSDQSLFPMDSAFKRRWDWEYIPIDYSNNVKSGEFRVTIDGTNYPWPKFIEKVNDKIYNLTKSEDKELGNFFIKDSVNENEFKSKVMFYLWYEVLRDETENKDYFFYKKKNTEEGTEKTEKFTFKNLYEDDANDTLKQFMYYLGIPAE